MMFTVAKNVSSMPFERHFMLPVDEIFLHLHVHQAIFVDLGRFTAQAGDGMPDNPWLSVILQLLQRRIVPSWKTAHEHQNLFCW